LKKLFAGDGLEPPPPAVSALTAANWPAFEVDLALVRFQTDRQSASLVRFPISMRDAYDLMN